MQMSVDSLTWYAAQTFHNSWAAMIDETWIGQKKVPIGEKEISYRKGKSEGFFSVILHT